MPKKRIFSFLVPFLSLTLIVIGLNRSLVSANDVEPRCYLPLIMTPCRPGVQVYSDDFSDPNSGWITFSTSDYEANYYGGEYRLLTKIAYGRLGLANGGNGISTEYMLEVDVRNVDGKPGEYGVIFGFAGGLDLDFYTFMIGPTGNFAIYYNEQVMPEPLQTTLLYSGWSDVIQPGSTSNTLGIIHTASTMEFFVNGQSLSVMPSDRIGSEQSGMMAIAGNQANLDIRYDNFKVYEYLCYSDDQIAAENQEKNQPSAFTFQAEVMDLTEP